MRIRFVKSQYILAAVALAWAVGFILLHLGYVRPKLSRQLQQIENDSVAEWLRLSNYNLRTRRGQMVRRTAGWAAAETARAYLADPAKTARAPEIPTESLDEAQIQHLLVCDPEGRLLSAWRMDEAGRLAPEEGLKTGRDLSGLPVFRLFSRGDEVSGIGQTPLGLAMFARCAVEDADGRRLGYFVSVRRVDDYLFAEVSVMAGATASFQESPRLPVDKPLSTFGQVVWREREDLLKGAQVFRDSLGMPLGYMVVEGEPKANYRHTRLVERALTISLLWAVGFALLMMSVIHKIVSGPMASLVNRVERMRAGEKVPSLSSGLRGEAMMLALRFEEVLGQVERLSDTDPLTGVSNRREFRRVLLQEFQRARRHNRPISAVMIDIDFFKAANDAMGHQAGDEMLEILADVLTRNVRSADTVARLGGDEFAVLLPETPIADAVKVVERMRTDMAGRSVGREDLRLSLTISAGVVDLNCRQADSPESFLDLADQALYAAKRAGRNRVVRADQVSEHSLPAEDEQERVDHLNRQLARLDAKFKRLFVDAIGGLISALEARDEHTANHSAKVRRYVILLGRQMGLPEGTVDHLGRAAMLHDIGKIGLPDSVLLKEGKLAEAEWELVKRHPVMSVRIMEGMAFLDQEIPAVRYHHERYDGGGYPEGLSGSAVPLGARIMAVADAFDAMTSSRVYRQGMPVEQALEELRRGSGTQFDPTVVEAFLKVVGTEDLVEEIVAANP